MKVVSKKKNSTMSLNSSVQLPNARAFAQRRCAAWTLIFIGFALFGSGCRLNNPPPTRIESGLRYQSGQVEYDTFFNEFHTRQVELYQAPDEERNLRREFSTKVEVAAGMTAQAIIDVIVERAKKLANDKIYLRLKVEGYTAEDEIDTMVQSSVQGTLDDSSKVFVESATLLARQELRHAAKLRKLNKQLRRLVIQEQSLEPSVDATFSGQGEAKVDEVRRNLLSTKRSLPVMSLQAAEQAESATQFVQKLATSLTTEPAVQETTNDPPLIAPTPQKRSKASPPQRRVPSGTATKPKPSAVPKATGSGDFEP
jgi:hypothetical protein